MTDAGPVYFKLVMEHKVEYIHTSILVVLHIGEIISHDQITPEPSKSWNFSIQNTKA